MAVSLPGFVWFISIKQGYRWDGAVVSSIRNATKSLETPHRVHYRISVPAFTKYNCSIIVLNPERFFVVGTNFVTVCYHCKIVRGLHKADTQITLKFPLCEKNWKIDPCETFANKMVSSTFISVLGKVFRIRII